MMRVATFALSDQMIAAALRSQSAMANDQLQEAAGVVSPDYGGLGQTSRQVVNLQVSVSRSQSYIDAATDTDNKVQVTYSTITQITGVLDDLRTALTAASNSASVDPANVAASAQQGLQEMASLLNTQYEGKYVFGGARTETPPVDISRTAYPPATSPSSPNTSYYQGDDQLASTRASDSEVVTYGVTADNSAFEQGMRALSLVANNSPLSADTLNEALNLTVSAIDGTASVQTGLGLASSSLQRASSYQSDYQNFAKTLGDDLTGVDVAAVTAQLSTYQAQLSASYSAISKIQGLDLASYLH